MSSTLNINISNLAAGAARGDPTTFAMVLFPGFQLLDVFGPLDALAVLSSTVPLEPLILLAETLEPVHSGLPAATAPGASPRARFGASVLPTHTFAAAPADIDVLLVPGGPGALPHIITARAPHPVVAFIRARFPQLRHLITICNGAGWAAEAGVLDGRRATTDKALWARTTELGPRVAWVKTARWVVDGGADADTGGDGDGGAVGGGKVWTSGGVSAGLDATLGWIAGVFGEAKAREVANVQEYEWKNDPNWDTFGFVWGDGK